MDTTKIKAAFKDFLVKRLVPLDQKIKFIILLAFWIVPVVVFVFLSFSPSSDQIASLEKQRLDLQKQIDEVKARAAEQDKYEAELAETQMKFTAASQLLPQQKEIPSLLTNISSLGSNAGLDFLTFQPGGERPKEFFAEIPLTISVRGPYHNVGTFLYNVSKLDRIVSVTNISLGGGAKERGEMMLSVNLNLVTYRFLEVQEAVAESPKEGKKSKKGK
jgi:type IV pilus assembly protein PilO